MRDQKIEGKLLRWVDINDPLLSAQSIQSIMRIYRIPYMKMVVRVKEEYYYFVLDRYLT